MERHDQYWGSPETDQAAVDELQRLQERGAKFFVLAWPAFWWREAYPTLFEYLNSKGTCRLNNERVFIYRLPERA
jgi:hypothetical protein